MKGPELKKKLETGENDGKWSKWVFRVRSPKNLKNPIFP